MFTCTARDECHDASEFANAFPAVALAGMPAGGEIGPQTGYQVIGQVKCGRAVWSVWSGEPGSSGVWPAD